MHVICKTFEFSAGHRILGHEGKCRFLHGHNYKAEVFMQCQTLNQLGMVMDFGTIKDVVGKWINENWDHNMILNPNDPQVLHLKATEDRSPFLMNYYGTQDSLNPTAENMARELHRIANQLLQKGSLRCHKVRIWETPSSFAEVEGGVQDQ